MSEYYLANYGYKTFDNNQKWDLRNIGVVRLHYIEEGSGWYLFNGEKIPLKAGNIYIIPSYYNYIADYNKDEPFTHLFFDFFTDRFFGFDKPICFDVRDCEPVMAILTAIISIFKGFYDGTYDRYKKKPSVVKMFYVLMDFLEEHYEIKHIEDKRIEKVLKFIYSNYAEQISVDDMANILYLNKNYFTRMFTQKVKMTPHEFLVYYRITKGLEMLNKGMKVTEAAEKVGYKNANSFSNAVKKYTGMSPKSNIKVNKTL